MHRVRSKRRIYFGRVILDSQPIRWTKEHRSFASKEWFESQVRYGKWIRQKGNRFVLRVTVLEGTKPLVIMIKIRHFPQGTRRHNYDHVLVKHAHVLRKK